MFSANARGSPGWRLLACSAYYHTLCGGLAKCVRICEMILFESMHALLASTCRVSMSPLRCGPFFARSNIEIMIRPGAGAVPPAQSSARGSAPTSARRTSARQSAAAAPSMAAVAAPPSARQSAAAAPSTAAEAIQLAAPLQQIEGAPCSTRAAAVAPAADAAPSVCSTSEAAHIPDTVTVPRHGEVLRRRALTELIETERQKEVTGDDEEPLKKMSSLASRLGMASFGVDATFQRSAALELAHGEMYSAAKNYLLLYLAYDPLPAAADQDCERAIHASRAAATKAAAESLTWRDCPVDWRDRLRIAHRLLLANPVLPSGELKAWLKMLLVSPSLFGAGVAKHLVFALAELLRAKLNRRDRFAPNARVLAYNDKTGGWSSGFMLPPDEEGATRDPVMKTPPKRGASTTTGRGAPLASHAFVENQVIASPKREGGLASLMAPTAAFTAGAAATYKTKRSDEPQLYRVRLKATADLPQRNAWLKPSQVLCDIESGTTKAYVPGILLLEASALGRVEIVAALLDCGVSISESDEEASTALLHAAYRSTTPSHREVCRCLIERRADPDMENVPDTPDRTLNSTALDHWVAGVAGAS